MKKILSLLALMMLCIVGANAETVTYPLHEGDTFASGQTVEVKNGEAVVATITYGESGGADFNAATADSHIDGFTAYTPGNGVNGNKTGGTFYTITPKVNATITVGVVLNADKAFYIEEDGTALDAYNGITVGSKYYGTYEFDATANKAYKIYCAGSKLGFYGFEMNFESEATTDETYTIGANVNGMGANMDLTLAEGATLPYTATFADCYRGAMGSEPAAMIQIQNAVVTSGTNVTLGTLNGWDTTFTISEEGTSVISLTTTIGAMTITVNVAKYVPAETKTFTLVPGPWEVDGARFAAWTWNNEEDGQWIDFTKVGETYTISVPAANTGLILARMNGETTENNWNEGTLWNKTGDIDITNVPDNSVFTITGWGESDYTISPAATPLDAAKAALQAAIDKVKAFGLDGLADVIAAAEAAVAAEDATIESVTAAAAAFQDGVKTYVMGVLTTLKQYMSTFSGAAAEALKEDFEKLEADINSNDIDAVKTDIASLMVKGSSYLQADIEKLEGYAEVLNSADITADVAAMKAAVEAGSFAALLAAVEQFKADFLAAAPGFVQQIKFAAAGYKDAGKTNAMEQLEAAIAAAEQAIAAEDATIVTVGLAIRNLIVAVKTHLAANSTYTIAGTKDLTGTDNDWDVVEANNMTKSAEDYMYEWTAEDITVNAEHQPQFKVVITDIEGNQTWIPASEEGNNHNWIITPDVVGGEGVYTITITYNAKTQEINVINKEWAETIAAAEALVDENAVAVGKLLAAIETAKAATGTTADKEALQAAIAQYKADNADQEKDETAKVATNGWKKFDGSAAGVCATQFAPAITTYDGRTAQMAEVYESNGNRTGTIIYQDITGLTNGKYKVGFYGNAFSTSQRDGFECTMEDGATDVAYVFANEEKEYISARITTATTENDFRQFDVEVTDGNIKLGMGKDTEKSTNWHTIQIYQLTWFTTAKEVYAADQAELVEVIAEGKALLEDESKTNGRDAFKAVFDSAEQSVGSNMLNCAELENIIANLKDAIVEFKKMNWFIEFAAGEYYVIHAQEGLKMAAGHDWGTRGIINEAGLDLTLTPYEQSRTVTFDSRVSNGGNSHFLGSNLYMDSSEWGWALEDQGFGFYILNPNDGKYINIDNNFNLVLSDTPCEWIIVSKAGIRAQLLEEMAEATTENPVDATGLIVAPNFNRNDARNAEAWIVSEDCTNKNLSGGNQVNNCAESYHSTFTIMQTISNCPAGFYQLTAQGFYRQDDFEGEAPAAPVFFANEVNGNVPALAEGGPNGMDTASEAFTNGDYTIDPITFEVKEDGMMYIGITQPATNTQWVIWDNFQLKYFGQENPTTGIATVNVPVELNNGVVYNLAGQKLMKAQKGIYIINGKKVVVK